MDIRVERTEYSDIERMRDLYRQEANCQIVHDSIIRRGMADPYLIHVNSRPAGYGGIWNKYEVGRVMEFYTLPHVRAHALPMFKEMLAVSGATSMEAQTNMPLMVTMFFDCATDILPGAILFQDAGVSSLTCPEGIFRRAKPGDTDLNPDVDWVLEVEGEVVAHGGFLCHYNPPYGDVYMEVAESARLHGYGSYLVQEVKRMCYEAGKRPSARCNPANVASRKTLQKAGFLPCGRMLEGRIGPG